MLKTYGRVKYPIPKSAASKMRNALVLLSLNFLIAKPTYRDLRGVYPGSSLPEWKSKTSSSDLLDLNDYE